MAEDVGMVHGTGEGLTQVQRVIDVFLAPSKTFADILRSRSWWLPFLLLTLVSYTFSGVVATKVGLQQLAASVIRENPAAAEKAANASPEVQARTSSITRTSLQVTFLAAPVILLAVTAATALALWGTLNFVFGGRSTFADLFSMLLYAGLVSIPKALLGLVILLIGNDPQSFRLRNPVGTNVGFYLPVDSAAWLKSLTGSLDAVTVWYLIVLTIGCSIIARVSRGAAAAAVFGWWVVIVLVSAGWALLS